MDVVRPSTRLVLPDQRSKPRIMLYTGRIIHVIMACQSVHHYNTLSYWHSDKIHIYIHIYIDTYIHINIYTYQYILIYPFCIHLYTVALCYTYLVCVRLYTYCVPPYTVVILIHAIVVTLTTGPPLARWKSG